MTRESVVDGGLNSKIRILHYRGHGLRGEEYLRLQVLTRMLPAL